MYSQSELIESDTLNGAQHPRLTSRLIGHEKAWQTFLRCELKGEIHHAWMISGKKGVGKATFSWKLAARLLGEKKGSADISKRLTALSLSNLFLCRRPFDEKTKRLKKQITIEEIRKLRSFFYLSAIEDEWRVVIIDCADELNKSASNGLLKLLEEPPDKSIFFIITHQPQRLSATLRSRCRSLKLSKLSVQEIEQILETTNYSLKNKSSNDKRILSIISEGSAGMAITSLNNDGISFFKNCMAILNDTPNSDRNKIYFLAEKVRGNLDKFMFLGSIILIIIGRIVLLSHSNGRLIITDEENQFMINLSQDHQKLYKLTELHSKLSKSFLACYQLNLDPLKEIVNAFISIEESLK